MWKWSEGELWGNLILTDSQRDHHVCCSFTSISFSPISPSHTTMPFSLSFFILHNHNRHKERKIPDAILKHLCGVNERVSETQSKWIQGEWESIFFFISPAIVECGGSYLQPFCGCSKCGWFSKKKNRNSCTVSKLTLKEFLLLLPCSPFWLFLSSSYFISQG